MEYTPQELALAIRKLIENHPLNWEQGVWYGFTSMSSTVDSILQGSGRRNLRYHCMCRGVGCDPCFPGRNETRGL